ncbi:MAG: Mce protein [Mycobacterium sp.]|nr:Mce protein [Mycobacterium sp.]
MTVTTDDKTDDDQPAADDVIDDAEATEPESPEPIRRRRGITAAVLAVFVVLVSVSGFLGWRLWQHQQVTEAGQQARDAAVSYAQVLTSIDSDKVDENFDQVLAGATGEFKDMYSESSVQLRQLLIDNKATAHGVVVESAIQSAAKDRVVVLLFVDQSVSNANVPDPRLDRSRIKMTMEKVDGQWRAATVELP